MTANPEDWAIDSNEAVEITLRSSAPKIFHPDCTYPIFGDAETIYGYKGLKVKLWYAPWDFRGYVKVSWREKISPSLGVEVQDVMGILQEYLPEDVYDDENDFELYLANPKFEPPGEEIDSYMVGDATYTVYKSSLKDPKTVSLVDRLQIFVLFFIEGGSFIDTEDDRWQIYILYEQKASDEIPTIAGYLTAYPYHYHQVSKGSPSLNDSAFFDTVFNSPSNIDTPQQCRLRLSQFIILPPFQRAGHGGRFYDIFFKNTRADPTVQEISIEDPSAAFEDLRDRRDLKFLEENDVFKGIKPPVSKTWIEETRRKYKMPPRQFRRVLEMSLLRHINPREENEEYSNWRLLVKQRLYNHNIDTLAQLSKQERIDKLQQTFKSVEDDYLRILRGESNGYNSNGLEMIEEEEDEEDDLDEAEDGDEEEEEEEEIVPRKRMRFT